MSRTALSRSLWFPFAGVLALSGCTEPRLDRALDELNAAQRRWQAHAPADYQFTIQRSCFCAPIVTRPVTVGVQGTAVVSLVYADSGTAADSVVFSEFLTIDRVFTFLRQTLAGKPGSFTAAYDTQLGYPTQVSVDPIANAVDDEFARSVSSFGITGTPAATSRP